MCLNATASWTLGQNTHIILPAILLIALAVFMLSQGGKR